RPGVRSAGSMATKAAGVVFSKPRCSLRWIVTTRSALFLIVSCPEAHPKVNAAPVVKAIPGSATIFMIQALVPWGVAGGDEGDAGDVVDESVDWTSLAEGQLYRTTVLGVARRAKTPLCVLGMLFRGGAPGPRGSGCSTLLARERAAQEQGGQSSMRGYQGFAHHCRMHPAVTNLLTRLRADSIIL